MLTIKPLRNLMIVLLSVIFLSDGLFAVFARSYYVNDNISVPIYFSASEKVTAIDFSVSVSNGSLNSVTCGGAGFSQVGGGGSRCVLANLSGGASSGTVATVSVKATTVGTLIVSASGSLSNANGQAASGGRLSGGSYTVAKKSSGSTSKPKSTVVESEPVVEEVVKRFSVRSEDGSIIESGDSTVKVDDGTVEVVLHKGDYDGVTKIEASMGSSAVLNLKDFEISGEGDEVSKYELGVGLNISKTLSNEDSVVVDIPSGTSMFAFDGSEKQVAWEGGLNLPVEIESVEYEDGDVAFALMLGSDDLILVFDKGVKIVLPDQAGKRAAYSQLGVIYEIDNYCKDMSLSDSQSECYYYDGNDMVIYTKHFTTFFSYDEVDSTEAVVVDNGVRNAYLIGLIVSSVLLLITIPITVIYISGVVRDRRVSSVSNGGTEY